MFVAKATFGLCILAIGFCEAGFLDTIEKCGISDGACQGRLFKTILSDNADKGVPEHNIPPLRPYVVKDASISILGLTDVTVDKGTIEGMPDCTVTEMNTDIDEKYTYAGNFCDQITLKGHYIVKAGPLLSTMTGDSFSGDGNGFIQINKMILKMKIPFNVEKHDDGEIYLVPDAERSTYSTNVTQDIKFKIDNVIVGGQDVSELMNDFLNKNWEYINNSFGKFFSDRIMVQYYKSLQKFFSLYPIKNFVSDDLSRYVEE